jgi:hypothetical protein
MYSNIVKRNFLRSVGEKSLEGKGLHAPPGETAEYGIRTSVNDGLKMPGGALMASENFCREKYLRKISGEFF